MDTGGIQEPARRDRKGKRAGRRPRGVALRERNGYWHAHGSLRISGRSVRVRRSLGLAVAAVSQDEAETALDAYAAEIKARITGTVGRGDPASVAALGYLSVPRARPLTPSSIVIIKEITARFRERRLNEIPASDWRLWIDGDPLSGTPGRTTGRAAATRERILNGVFAFLNYCRRHHGLTALPAFERDKAARNPNRRARRRVHDLRPELIALLFDSAHIALRAQLAVEWCTGARVSSVLHGVKLSDLVLGEGREQIIFRNTKNGRDVAAALNATAVKVLKAYLKWRGRLHQRDGNLFLTWRREPYVDNGRAWGNQNGRAFKGAKVRAQKTLMERGEGEAQRLLKRGQRRAAQEARDRAAADAALIGSVTQHWFRHLMATKWLRKDPRAAMEQGGWLDVRSLIGYSHDVPDYRRALASEFDDLDTLRSRATAARREKRDG
jgi:hypothetical protein